MGGYPSAPAAPPRGDRSAGDAGVDSPPRNQAQIRKRLLSILSRATLDEIATVARPWGYDRPSLTAAILADWPQEEVAHEIARLVKKASDSPEASRSEGENT